MLTDKELMAKVDLILPLLNSAPWQRDLALTILREVQAKADRPLAMAVLNWSRRYPGDEGACCEVPPRTFARWMKLARSVAA